MIEKGYLLTVFCLLCFLTGRAQDEKKEPQEISLEQLQLQIDSMFSEYETCQQSERLTRNNLSQIHNPYEFTFLHKIPQNEVDSFVIGILSNAVRKDGRELVRKLAFSRSQEAFKLLYVCCAAEKILSRGGFFILRNAVINYGGFEALNVYFLDSVVSADVAGRNFRKRVIQLCAQKQPEIYYCHQPTINELYQEETKHIPIKKYDRQIIRIIRQNSDTRQSNCAAIISHKVQQLPFVKDVLWDGCYAKLAIYPGYHNLVVKITTGDKIVERSYHMKSSRLRYFKLHLGKCMYVQKLIYRDDSMLDYKNSYYAPGYIDAARAYCERQEKDG